MYIRNNFPMVTPKYLYQNGTVIFPKYKSIDFEQCFTIWDEFIFPHFPIVSFSRKFSFSISFSTNSLVSDRNLHLWSDIQQENHDLIKTLHDEDLGYRKIAKHLNEMGVKGKLGGSWTSSMVLRTCRYEFHETRRMFEHPEWWGSEPYHDSVDFSDP